MINKSANIVFKCSDGAFSASVVGEVDHHGAKDIREEIDEGILREMPKKVILDLSKVGFMDSSGLGIIMGRKMLCEKLGIEFSLYNPTGRISRILELAGLYKTVKVEYNSEDKNA